MNADSTDRAFDVVIAGAGIGGSVMAGLLLTQNVCKPGTVAVIAAGSAPQAAAGTWGLRVFALSRGSQRILDACGVWGNLPSELCNPYERMCVWDARGEPGGTGSLTFDCAALAEPNLGHIVDGDALQRECVRAASAAGAIFIEGALEAVSVDEDSMRARITDGRELAGQLLIAADGSDSAARGFLRIETAGHAYHQEALVAHLRTEFVHRHTAHQRFLAGGPLALLPLSDGRSSLVWSLGYAEAKRLRELDAAGFGAAVTDASAAVLGGCTLTTGIAGFPLQLQSAAAYVRPRAALIGDAAHVVHPLAGQGLNLGLLDCAALCEVLAPAAKSRSLGDLRTLRRFERWRRSENRLAALALDGLERLFAGDGAAAVLRRMGLNAIERLGPIKREFARRALGLSGDIPALARVRPAGGQPWPRR